MVSDNLDRNLTQNVIFFVIHIDFDGDGNADIIVTTDSTIELWKNMGTDKEIDQKFKNVKNISYPLNCTTTKCEIGQVC